MMYIALIIMFVIAAITWTIGQSLAETPPTILVRVRSNGTNRKSDTYRNWR
jgi:hypothetical protein